MDGVVDVNVGITYRDKVLGTGFVESRFRVAEARSFPVRVYAILIHHDGRTTGGYSLQAIDRPIGKHPFIVMEYGPQR